MCYQEMTVELGEQNRGTPYHKDFENEPIPERYLVVADRVGTNKRVLEVGCHSGYFSKVLHTNGCSVVGVELNAEAAHRALPVLEELVIGNADAESTWNRVHGEFDFILFMDVLEHLYNPWLVLENCRSRLKVGGRMLATLPNVACWSIRRELLMGRFVPPNTGLSDLTHIRWFTLYSALDLFARSGYEVLSFQPAWTCVPLDYRMSRIPWFGTRWRRWWINHHPNLAIAVPLIEGRLGTTR